MFPFENSRPYNPNPNPGDRRYPMYIQINYVCWALYEHNKSVDISMLEER
jgi:hypothetical protein